MILRNKNLVNFVNKFPHKARTYFKGLSYLQIVSLYLLVHLHAKEKKGVKEKYSSNEMFYLGHPSSLTSLPIAVLTLLFGNARKV